LAGNLDLFQEHESQLLDDELPLLIGLDLTICAGFIADIDDIDIADIIGLILGTVGISDSDSDKRMPAAAKDFVGLE